MQPTTFASNEDKLLFTVSVASFTVTVLKYWHRVLSNNDATGVIFPNIL